MRFFIAVVLLLLTGLVPAQTNMYVHAPGGGVSPYPIDSIRKLTFPQGQMQIHRTAGDTVTYGYPAIRMVNFSNLTTPVKGQLTVNDINLLSAVSESGNVTVNLKTDKPGDYRIEIYDSNGKLQSHVSVFSQGNNTLMQHQIPFMFITSGIYHCVVSNTTFQKSVKFTHLQ